MSRAGRRIGWAFGSALVVATAAGCSFVHPPVCAVGEDRSVHELMYFGTAKPGGVVTPGEWAEFLSSTVTPRFPQGLTVWQASGQWKGADGAIAREASYVLNLVHPDDERNEAAIRSIAAEYETRFSQEAVLRVRSRVCASFHRRSGES